MLGKLFGKKEAPKAQPKIDTDAALANLDAQIEQTNKRIKVVERQAKDLQQQAVQAKMAGDNRAALKHMKMSKMREKERVKLEGQELMMEEQKSMITQGKWDSNVVSALTEGQAAVKQANSQLSADKIDDLKADLEEQQEL